MLAASGTLRLLVRAGRAVKVLLRKYR